MKTSSGTGGAHAREAILIVGVNWVGDSIMTMPAIQAFRDANPEAYITLLAKPKLLHLWKLHAAPNEILPLKVGLSGMLQTVWMVRKRRFKKAYILPHSFRSALIPFLARVTQRIGMPGHWRGAMMTDVIPPKRGQGREHQAWEYMDLMCPDEDVGKLDPPQLRVPSRAIARAEEALDALPRPRVAMIPGAARGPSKRWPSDHFIALGKRLTEKNDCSIVTMGISKEADLCSRISESIGPETLNLAGQTSLAEWVALLYAADLVIANDSGGMHLAAAIGTPVVAIYGITDPSRTGPLGTRCTVVQNSEARDRDVDRDSPEAAKSLASVTAEQVYEAALGLLDPQEQNL